MASARVWVAGSVSLNTIPVRLNPNTTRPERFTHGIPKIREARHSGFQAVIASTMSSKRSRPGRAASATDRYAGS
jgi:hypothetical protein